jgi:hypothetical protein
MGTLTLDPKTVPARYRGRTDRYIRKLWRMMRVLLSRKFGESLPFIAVLEFTKNGVAHLHVLFGRYIRQDWLSDAWESIGGGKIVDIRFVDVHRVSAYLAVYLAGDKILHTLELLPKRARIFTTSRSIVLWGKKKTSGWKLRRISTSELYERAPNPSHERFEAVEDLKPLGLELLVSFESLIFQEAIGNRDVIQALKEAMPTWRAVNR